LYVVWLGIENVRIVSLDAERGRLLRTYAILDRLSLGFSET
jgi:hypothetical protein